MNICIPVTEDKGLDSPVSEHFGSAPVFLLVDTDSASCRAIPNRHKNHAHGMCSPLASLQGEQLDGIVVRGIGMGALNKLIAAGIRVLLAQQATVRDTLDAFKAGALRPVTPGMTCRGQGHRHRHGCGH